MSHHPVLPANVGLRRGARQAERHLLIQPRQGPWSHQHWSRVPIHEIYANCSKSLLCACKGSSEIFGQWLFCLSEVPELLGPPMSGINVLTSHWNGRWSPESSWMVTALTLILFPLQPKTCRYQRLKLRNSWCPLLFSNGGKRRPLANTAMINDAAKH